MLLLSDVAIRDCGHGRFSVVTPGYTSVITSSRGIYCLVLADGCATIADACRHIRKQTQIDPALARQFIRKATALGILYRSRRYRRHAFSAADVIHAVKTVPHYRSISEINLCPSTRCNLRCGYCSLWKGKARLSATVAKQLLDDARGLGANTLNILGGEPTLYAGLAADLIAHATGLGYERVAVSTNGLEFTSGIARSWHRSGLRTLQVSIDRLLGGGKSLEAAESAVRAACRAFPEVIVSYVYYGQDSQSALLPLIKELRKYPVVLDLKIAIPVAGEVAPVTPRDIRGFSRLARKLAKEDGFIVAPTFSDARSVFCGAGTCHAFVEASGAVKPCGFLPDVIGNVNDRPFYKIWLEPAWQKFQYPRPVRNPQCLRCRLRKYCIAGCAARHKSKMLTCPGSSRHTKHGLTVTQGVCIMSKVR